MVICWLFYEIFRAIAKVQSGSGRETSLEKLYKTWESTFKKQSPDGAAVLPPSKSAYQSFWIRVPQSAFFVMNFGAKILPPSKTSISANFCCCDTDALLSKDIAELYYLIFSNSVWLEQLTNMEAKGTKISVISWATNASQIFCLTWTALCQIFCHYIQVCTRWCF